jgi:hypothetical protein
MEDLGKIELTLDANQWGPPKGAKNKDFGYGNQHFASNSDTLNNSSISNRMFVSNIKGLCEVFLREKKEEKEGDGTAVNFETIELKQQAKKRITSNKKFAGQKNAYNKMHKQNWMSKNKGNTGTGKKKKMIDGQRVMQNAAWRKEMRAKAKAYKKLSINIDGNWPLIDEIQNVKLTNLPKFTPGASKVFCRAGKVGEYRHEVDSLTTKQAIKFSTFQKIDDNKNSTHEVEMDTHIFNEIEKEAIEGLKIIASDRALATLMNLNKAYYSWDIHVEKIDDMLIFYKKEDPAFEFASIDLETCGENSMTPPPASAEDTKLGKHIISY